MKQRLAHWFRLVAWVSVAGLAAGILWLGIGGRLLMALLAATSDDSVHGAFSDDGEEIGAFTLSGTIGLLLFAGVLFGIAGGLVHGLVRPTLPRPPGRRALASGALAAILGVFVIVDPDGRDFSILEPAWLAVSGFVVLGFGFGATVSLIADRTRRFYETAPMRVPHLFAFAPVLVLAPALPLGFAAVVGGLIYAAQRQPISTNLLRGARIVVGVLAVVVLATGISDVGRLEHRPPRQSDFVDPFP